MLILQAKEIMAAMQQQNLVPLEVVVRDPLVFQAVVQELEEQQPIQP